jgi:hypothetical protein
MYLDKLVQFLIRYRNEIVVGVIVFLFLIFRDAIKSFL